MNVYLLFITRLKNVTSNWLLKKKEKDIRRIWISEKRYSNMLDNSVFPFNCIKYKRSWVKIPFSPFVNLSIHRCLWSWEKRIYAQSGKKFFTQYLWLYCIVSQWFVLLSFSYFLICAFLFLQFIIKKELIGVMKSIFLFVFAKEEGINEILNFIFAASLFNIYHQRDYVRCIMKF